MGAVFRYIFIVIPTQLHVLGKVLGYLNTDKHFKNNTRGSP